jgi:spore germination protein YaaH
MEQLSFDAFNFDEVAKQPYVQYESDSMVNTIWYENENSISEKIKLIYDYDLGGLSVWQLGNMVNDVDETVSEKYQLNIWEKIMENNRSSD